MSYIDNPFRHNYLFSEYDKLRKPLQPSLVEKIRLWFRPTYMQVGSDSNTIYFFKVMDGEYWLISHAPLPEARP